MTLRGEDQQFVIRVIQFLDFRCGIRFFITSKDFDVLYRWWEKGIPFHLVARSIEAVAERRAKKNRKISGFSAFHHEVKKRYQAFLTLQDGGARRSEEAGDGFDRVREFLAKYPPELEPLRPEIESFFLALMAGREPDADAVHERLLGLFREDEELQAKAESFLRQLAPPLRKPELERTYRLNFLIRRYGIPFP